MFPVVPICGIDRKKEIERLLKQVKQLNSKVRCQIRLGERDFKVFMKIYNEGEFEPYREIPLEILDPHDEFPAIKTATTNKIPEEDHEYDKTNIEIKDLVKLPEKIRRMIFKKMLSRKDVKVSSLQISEFLVKYLQGTSTNAHKDFLEVCPAAIVAEMEPAAGPSQL